MDVPIQLSGFEFLEKLGQGGMAVVWKTRQISLDRIVAIKFLQAELAQQAEEVQRLMAEARSAAKLKHQGIVQVYDANEVNGVYFIVMEYIAGYSIGDLLRRKDVLDEQNALLIAECVATALHYAWTMAGIIHCDIKPDNVMVDRDGTIKVADLGLSRTIGSRSMRADLDEVVMGTPSYISPEQSRGGEQLDCRTDIYSLGAMLYHMVTGRRLFEECSDSDAMDRQITHQDKDPFEIVPSLSPGICMLIERMLIKDRGGRHADWEEVLKDIHAVQLGKMPSGPIPPDGASTIKRSARRPVRIVTVLPQAAAAPAAATVSPPSRSAAPIGFAILAVLALAAGGWWFVTQRGGKGGGVPAGGLPGTGTVTVVTGVAPHESAASHAGEAYEFVQKWAKDHPGEYAETIARFQKIADETKGTKFSLMAVDDVKRLQTEWQQKVDEVLQSLTASAEAQAGAHEYDRAVETCEKYTGPWWKETEKRRLDLAARMRKEKGAWEEEQKNALQREEQRYAELVGNVAALVVTGQLARAQEALALAAAEKRSGSRKESVQEMLAILSDAMSINDRLVETFRQQIGQDVTVALVKGPMSFTVRAVERRTVKGEQRSASGGNIQFEFSMDELSAQERLARMGTNDVREVALIKGMMAMQARAYSKAREFFAKTSPALADPLVNAVKEIEQRGADEKAEAALVKALKSVPIEVGAYNEKLWLETIRNADLDAGKKDALAKQMEKYKERYGATAFAARAEPVLAAIRALCRAEAPGATVPEAMSKPPAEEDQPPPSGGGAPADPEQVLHRLLGRNPGLKEHEVRTQGTPESGITRMEIISPAIRDLSALSDLVTLQELAAGGVRENEMEAGRPLASLRSLVPLSRLSLRKLYVGYSEVDDLSPLKGIRLRSLNLNRTRVKDIGVLQDAVLEELNVHSTGVKDISVLRGKPVRNLDIADTKVGDLAALSGAPLRNLNAENTAVVDIGVLRGMPLEGLNLANTRVHEFSVLKGLSLTYLNLNGTQFRDLAFCKGMPLRRLELRNTKVGDLAILDGMSLEYLDLKDAALVKDLEPLRGMPIKWLAFGNTRVRTISPLRGMPLEYLDLSSTSVADLSPLKDAKLVYLDISESEVRDLEILRNMPLRTLRLDLKRIKDLRVIRTLPLEDIWVTGADWENQRWLFESLPNVRRINGASRTQ